MCKAGVRVAMHVSGTAGKDKSQDNSMHARIKKGEHHTSRAGWTGDGRRQAHMGPCLWAERHIEKE